MIVRSFHCGSTGFTLVEVVVSLGLCALLAGTIASAITFAARAERIAARNGTSSLFVQTLYAAQRLRPGDLPAAPPGWTLEHTTEIITLPDESLREWHLLALSPLDREIPPVTLRVLDDTP